MIAVAEEWNKRFHARADASIDARDA